MTTNDQHQQGGPRRRGGKNGVAYLSGVAVATGAAMALGSQVARHHVPGAKPLGGSTRVAEAAVAPRPSALTNGSSQVAQATARPTPGSGGGYDAASALAVRDDDESLGTTADYHTFDSVYQLVQEHYVDSLPTDTKMAQGAVRYMVASLTDPNSYFLDSDQRAMVDSEARGAFHGIGAVTSVVGFKQPEGYTEYKIVVVDALPGSPAAKAGIKSGDVITHVDGKWVLGSDPFLKANKLYDQVRNQNPDLDDAFRKEYESARKRALGGIGLAQAQLLLRKGSGDARTLQIQRNGSPQPTKVTLTTAETTVDPVSARPTPDGKATVIRISLLTEKAPAEVKQALSALPKGRGVVLDLRGNPGGVSSASIAPAQQLATLLAPGKPLGVEIVHGGRKQTLAAPSHTGFAHPLVVLVDKGTARTAEALAVSLRDAGAATLVGGKTFGDATSRTLYSLPDGSGFLMTTGKLLSPKGTDWQMAGGLTPQVALAAGLPDEQVIAKAASVLRRTQPVAAAAATAARTASVSQP